MISSTINVKFYVVLFIEPMQKINIQYIILSVPPKVLISVKDVGI